VEATKFSKPSEFSGTNGIHKTFQNFFVESNKFSKYSGILWKG